MAATRSRTKPANGKNASAVLPVPKPNKAAEPAVPDQKMLIGGKWVDAASGKTFETINPATGEVICQVAEGDKADVDLAVKAARKAFEDGPWPKMSAAERGRLHQQARRPDRGEHGRAGRARIARQRQAASRDSLGRRPAAHRSSATATTPAGPTRSTARPSRSTGNYFCYTRHEPVGVVGQIIPWNFPLLMQAWKWGPALACGNTVVLKPAEQTPLTALRVARTGAGGRLPRRRHQRRARLRPDRRRGALPAHMDVDKVAFTGETDDRQDHHEGRRPEQPEARQPGTGRQESRTSSSPTPTSTPPSRARTSACSSTRASAAAPAAGCSSRRRSTTSSSRRCSAKAKGRKVGDPFDPDTDAGAAGVAGAVRPHHGLHRRRQEGRGQAADRRQARRRPRATSSSRPCSPTSRTR